MDEISDHLLLAPPGEAGHLQRQALLHRANDVSHRFAEYQATSGAGPGTDSANRGPHLALERRYVEFRESAATHRLSDLRGTARPRLGEAPEQALVRHMDELTQELRHPFMGEAGEILGPRVLDQQIVDLEKGITDRYGDYVIRAGMRPLVGDEHATGEHVSASELTSSYVAFMSEINAHRHADARDEAAAVQLHNAFINVAEIGINAYYESGLGRFSLAVMRSALRPRDGGFSPPDAASTGHAEASQSLQEVRQQIQPRVEQIARKRNLPEAEMDRLQEHAMHMAAHGPHGAARLDELGIKMKDAAADSIRAGASLETVMFRSNITHPYDLGELLQQMHKAEAEEDRLPETIGELADELPRYFERDGQIPERWWVDRFSHQRKIREDNNLDEIASSAAHWAVTQGYRTHAEAIAHFDITSELDVNFVNRALPPAAPAFYDGITLSFTTSLRSQGSTMRDVEPAIVAMASTDKNEARIMLNHSATHITSQLTSQPNFESRALAEIASRYMSIRSRIDGLNRP